MNHLATNIRYLRKQKALTQEQLAQHIGIKRAAMGAYEEGRSEPRLSTLTMLCQYFKIRMDQLVLRDLTTAPSEQEVDVEGRQLRVLPIVLSGSDEKELGSLVNVKASAGYLNGYGDADYVGALPRFSRSPKATHCATSVPPRAASRHCSPTVIEARKRFGSTSNPSPARS